VFTGLAHMGSAAGIVLGFAYCIYLIFKREFKGALIVFLSWNAILIPIYLRNYYIAKDFGAGLYIPFSGKVSEILYFLPSKVSEFKYSNVLLSMDFTETVTPIEFLQRTFEYFVLWNTDYLIWFLALGIIVFFVALIVYKLFTLSRAHILIISYSVLNIFSLYFFTLVNPGFYAGNKHMALAVFLLIPIAIFGFEKIFEKIKQKKPVANLKIISLVVMVLFISPTLAQSVDGLTNFDLPLSRWYSETAFSVAKNMTNYITQNLPRDAIVASNNPGDVYIRTGLKATTIPSDVTCNNIEKFIQYFKIDYIVWYPPQYSYPIIKERLTDFANINYGFQKIYEFNPVTFQIFKVKQNFENIINLSEITESARNFQSQGRYDDAVLAYRLITVPFYNQINSLNLPVCDNDLIFAYVVSLQNEVRILNEQKKFVEAKKSSDRLLSFYERTDDITKSFDRTLFFYEKILQSESKHADLDLVNIKQEYVGALYSAAEFYESISHETRELQTYQKLIEFDRTNIDALLNAARLYEHRGLDWQALREYENAIRFGLDSSDILLKIEELKSKLNT